MSLNLDIKKTTKDQFVQDISLGGNSMMKQVIDGNKGYAMGQGQRKDLSEDELAKIKPDSAPFPELNLLNGGATLEGIEKVNGEDAYVIKLSEEKSAYYSTKTGLKIQEITVAEAQGQTFKTGVIYSDYKEVGGIKFPFALGQSLGPQKVDFKVTEIKVNEGVSDVDFD